MNLKVTRQWKRPALQAPDLFQKMKELTPLIPGIYADGEGRAVLDMAEFLTAHGLPDAPEVRAVIWEEIQEIFGDVEVYELPDGDDLDS